MSNQIGQLPPNGKSSNLPQLSPPPPMTRQERQRLLILKSQYTSLRLEAILRNLPDVVCDCALMIARIDHDLSKP